MLALDCETWVKKNAEYKVLSIEKVGDELEAGDDSLSEWAQQLGASFFVKPDSTILPALQNVSTWATEQNYDPAAVNTFLQVADYYLIAHGVAQKHTIVTHEKPANSTKKIKIPDVCIGLGIKFMSPYEMLRHERAKFVLGR